MHEVRLFNMKEIKSMQTYSEFVYAIACNVPYSTVEEGQMNKMINKTETKQKQRKIEKGYFYLENLSLKEDPHYLHMLAQYSVANNHRQASSERSALKNRMDRSPNSRRMQLNP